MKKARKKITTTEGKRMFSVFHLSVAIFSVIGIVEVVIAVVVVE